MNIKAKKTKSAFTLIELLVVLAVIAILMSIMLPCLGTAQNQCRTAVCRSNIRQLYIANTGYAFSNNDFYVRASRDLFVLDNGKISRWGGMHRWHGVRQSDGVSPVPSKNIFDPLKGPLSSYLNEGKVKECPAKFKYTQDGKLNAFEAGCGGYGYNSVGIGSRSYSYGWNNKAMRSSMKSKEIKRSYQKIMFTDTAFIQNGLLIEYSFSEPPMFVLNFGSEIQEFPGVIPSIHFRHLDKTNVVWCDGHITSETLDFPNDRRYGNVQFKLGWFGPKDNSLFKPK